MTISDSPTILIETHGCKLNQADSQIIARRFIKAGYRIVDEQTQASVNVINTCTVTHVADRKGRHSVMNARRRNPKAIIVATGCYVQRDPERLAQMDAVDLVLGNTKKGTLVEQISQVIGLPLVTSSTDAPQDKTSHLRTRAMVKIQEGCNQICAYCIVPKVRGRERSLHPDLLVAQIRRLVDEGYLEVVLTGTQLGS